MLHSNLGTCQPSLTAAEERLPRARLTLHESDPITGNEDRLSSLFYEFYRGYTIYSTPRGCCCVHGTRGCLRLRSKFVCFYDVEEAKTFIKHLRREGYCASDCVERYLPPEDYVWLNCWTRPRRQQKAAAQPAQPVS
jgi:hypothetical protein